MSNNNVHIAESYYTSFGTKNVAGMEKHLHPNVQFTSPLAQLSGKEAVLELAQKHFSRFNSAKIRSKFGEGDEVFVALDLLTDAHVVRSAAYLTVKENLIERIEVFFDPR